MIGSTIGTYRMAELLGDGGLGPVYRGVDQGSGREAAFRVFSQEVSRDPMLSERLRAMSAVLKKLQHPNIGAVYELLTVGPDLAMFLEYVPGAPLDQVRKQTGRLEVNAAVSCAVQVLRALEFAHSIGVLHHALRPSNIRVTPQGTVKVMDFGIGHAFGANRKTREDRLLTVLAYLAPEQIQNQPGDARSDLYSVGVVLYELLTGRLPFDQKTEFALRQSHLQEPVVPPRSYVPALPEWLDQAVMRALAKNPGARFQNATECRAVLEAALGLSTSKAAAVVRDAGGTTVTMFEAAPPIPPAHPPASEHDATRASGPVPPVPAAPSPKPSAEATVVLKATEPPPAAAPAPPPPPARTAPDADATIFAPSGAMGAQATIPVEAPDAAALTPPPTEHAAGGAQTAEPHAGSVPTAGETQLVDPAAAVEAVLAAAAGPGATMMAPPSSAKPATAGGKKAVPPAGGKGGGSKALVAVVVGVVVLVLAAAAVGGFLWWRGQQQAPAADAAAAVTPAATPPAAEPAPATPPTGAPAQAAADATTPAGAAAPVSSIPPPSAAAAQTPAMPPPAAASAAPPKRPPAATKPKPAEPATQPVAVVTAPPPVPAAPAAAPPAAEPPAAAKPSAHVVNLPDVSFRKVKLVTQEGSAETAVDVVLMFLEDRVTVTPTAGGTTLRSVRYVEIGSVTYAREEKKRLGLIKTAQHQLTIDTRPTSLILRLDKDNVEAILSAFESRTGKPVAR